MTNGVIKCSPNWGRVVRFLLMYVLVCAPLTNAKANYYYKVQLKDSNGNLVKFKASEGASEATSEWSGWIYCEQEGSGNNIIIKNRLGYLIPNDKGYELTGVTDEFENDIWMKREGEAERTLVGIAFKGQKEDNFEILQFDDWFVLDPVEDNILTLDLSEWGASESEHSSYFSGMDNLETLIMPNRDFKIKGKYMFSGAGKLKNILLGENTVITEIGYGAFENCVSLPLKQVQQMLENCTGKLGDLAFNNCPGIKGIIKIPNTVTEIGEGTFKGCTGISGDVIIPASVTKVGKEAFYRNLSVSSFEIAGQENGTVSIGESAFSQNKEESQLGSVTFGAGSYEIGKKAFQGCEVLATVGMSKAENGDWNQKIKKLGEAAFADCRSINNESVNSILASYAANSTETVQLANGENVKYIPAYLFYGCNGSKSYEGSEAKSNFNELIIPSEYGAIGRGAFGAAELNNPIKKITVSRGDAPVCGIPEGDFLGGERSSFQNVVPNHVTINFEGDASRYSGDDKTGYTSYMYDDSEFERLLTKDIYARQKTEEYDVVPQQHAIVRLHRTLKEGWNTLCLPFGATHAAQEIPEGGAKYYNCRLIQRALTPANNTKSDNELDNNTNFMIAVYRDYIPERKLFRFLHFQGYDEYPISSYEAFMVRMDKADIDEAAENKDDEGLSVYTFENVDVNYEWIAGDKSESGNDGYDINRKKISNPDEINAREWYGQSEPFQPFNDGKGNTNTYIFTGTFKTLIGNVGKISDITTNDYYIQNVDGVSNSYLFKDNENYGIYAFSGWFHYAPKGNGQVTASKENIIQLSIIDGSDETTEIARINQEGNELPCGNVYNMNGQLVRTDAEGVAGLPKGLYIMNGKKFIVK